MKKLLLILLAVFMFVGCGQPTTDNAGIIQRTDDLSSKVLDLASEYQKNSYELSREVYSDTVQTMGHYPFDTKKIKIDFLTGESACTK